MPGLTTGFAVFQWVLQGRKGRHSDSNEHNTTDPTGNILYWWSFAAYSKSSRPKNGLLRISGQVTRRSSSILERLTQRPRLSERVVCKVKYLAQNVVTMVNGSIAPLQLVSQLQYAFRVKVERLSFNQDQTLDQRWGTIATVNRGQHDAAPPR